MGYNLPTKSLPYEIIMSERFFLTKLFPGENDSPTLGQVQVLVNIKAGELISEDVANAVLATATRNPQKLAEDIYKYNSWLSVGVHLKELCGFIFPDLIAESYGEDTTTAGISHRSKLLVEGLEKLKTE